MIVWFEMPLPHGRVVADIDLDNRPWRPNAPSEPDACVTSNSKSQPRFQILVPVNRNGNHLALALLGIDVVAAVDAPK